MPIYPYLCNHCKHEWETQLARHDDPAPACPQCNGQDVKRLISDGTSFVLTGSGWYAQGYQKFKGPPRKGMKKRVI